MRLPRHPNRHDLLPAGILVVGLLLVLFLGGASKQREDDRILLETRVTAEQVRIRIESCVDARARLIEALAELPRESVQQTMQTWTDSARILLPIHSGVQALNYVDPERIIRVVYPLEANRAALNADLGQHPNPSVGEALTRAESSTGLARTDIIQLLQSGKGFAVYRQILSPDGRALGFVNGVFRVNDLLDSCLSEQPLRDRFIFDIREDDELIHTASAETDPLQSRYQVALPIDMMTRTWQLVFAPSAAYLATLSSPLDEIGIGLGVLMSFLMALVSRILISQQRALSDREAQYRLLVENQTDLVVKVSPQGEFLYVSPSYCTMFGKPESEMLGSQFMPLVHEDDQEVTRRSLVSLTHPPHTSYHEQRAMTRDGWRWLAWSNKALLDANGDIEAITAVGRDITETRMLEENIAHSQKMNAMGEMAGGITHDFNNLLQVIMGNIENLLVHDTHDQTTRKSLAQMYKVVLRAMSLTEKLSTLSRQDRTQTETFDLNRLLDESVALLERTLPASITLTSSPSDSSLAIDADRTQIEQVVLNICFNARDAMNGSGEIRIDTDRRHVDEQASRQGLGIEPGDYAVITIEDEGSGIEADVLPRIFEPFYTTKPRGSGTGLGLANCYSIVKQHHGMIQVESKPGKGSRFRVYLPLSGRGDITTLDDTVATHAPQASGSNRVLVADDNDEILALTCAYLESVGFETLRAASGREALSLFEMHHETIALVVLDFVMPEMGGQEVVDHIRAMDRDVKVLFVTGFIPDDVMASLEDPIMRKPYRRVEFLEMVERLIKA